MVNPEKQQSVGERPIEDIDRVDQSSDDVYHEDSSSVDTSSPAISGNSSENRGSGVEVGLTERLTVILVEEGDGDLLLQQNGREDAVLQWLQALDLQVIGACRADERLKPLLKLNVSGGAAEDRLLAHLSQHFEPSEVGMLARCLCVPLVSIRVGKINQQGTLLCPTASRGNLNLALLPTSGMRISFVGDDGCSERLATISSDFQCSAVSVEEIQADSSGRSFSIKMPDGKVFYFWCAEKSKLLGIDLLLKMKDLLMTKPSLTELTGISESRLDCFATLLRAYLVGSTVANTRATAVASLSSSSDTTLDPSELGQTAQSSAASLKPSRSRYCGSQAAKTNSLYQGSLSPRPSSFKEGLPRNLSSLRSVVREKLRRRGDCNFPGLDNTSCCQSVTKEVVSSSSDPDRDKVSQNTATHLFSSSSFLEVCEKSTATSFLIPESHVPSFGSSLLSPYYCWCPPPVVSTLQYTVESSKLHIPATESLSLPPLSSLLQPASRCSSILTPVTSLNFTDSPPLEFPLDFPPFFLPEPLVRLPLSMANSQQIPTFTPLMCDSIVHIPVVEVCSSGGQGYLVSAGPGLSTSIVAPLPLMGEADSMVENSARETLRLLIGGGGGGSSQTSLQLMDVFPSAVLGNATTDEKQGILVSGSRGLYSGSRDVGVMANSFAAMGLASSLSERCGVDAAAAAAAKRSDSGDQLEIPNGGSGPGGSCFAEQQDPTSSK